MTTCDDIPPPAADRHEAALVAIAAARAPGFHVRRVHLRCELGHEIASWDDCDPSHEDRTRAWWWCEECACERPGLESGAEDAVFLWVNEWDTMPTGVVAVEHAEALAAERDDVQAQLDARLDIEARLNEAACKAGARVVELERVVAAYDAVVNALPPALKVKVSRLFPLAYNGDTDALRTSAAELSTRPLDGAWKDAAAFRAWAAHVQELADNTPGDPVPWFTILLSPGPTRLTPGERAWAESVLARLNNKEKP